MSQVTLKGHPVKISGELPETSDMAALAVLKPKI